MKKFRTAECIIRKLYFLISFTDSYKQKKCIDNCTEKHLQSLECIPNPFINHSFVLIDSNQTSFKICENEKNITIDFKYCYKECPKHCLQSYKNLKTQTFINNFNGNSYIKIFNNKEKQYFYQAESELSIIKYIADLGGLFGLYLGISLIDMGKVIKNSIKYMKIFINYMKNTKYFKIIKLSICLEKINTILNYNLNINFNLISNILSNPILIFELLSMMNLYFQYSTQTNYEFIPYNISDNKYSLNEFPSITICNEQLFDEIWFKNYFNSDIVRDLIRKWEPIYNFKHILENSGRSCETSRLNLNKIYHNITNKHVIYSMNELIFAYCKMYLMNLPLIIGVHEDVYFDQYISMAEFILNKLMANNHDEFNNKTLQFEDKHSYGLSPVKQLFDFYGQHYRCVTDEPSINCSQLSPTLSLLSPMGKCHTFLTNIYNQSYVKSINIFTNLFIFSGNPISLFPHYLLNRYYFQDRLGLPSDKSMEIIPIFNYMHKYYNMLIELKKTLIKRLEKPYDTECHDYGNSNQINCLNKCLVKKYKEKYNCIPNHNKYHTLKLNFSEENNLFCPYFYTTNITHSETNFQIYCKEICGNPCEETLFKAQYEVGETTFLEFKLNLFFRDKIYSVINYNPKITFIDFLINIFNIWNLWHGTSLKTIITILSNISKRITTLLHLSIIPFNKKLWIKIISLLLAIIFTQQILSKTIEYFQFETITKINLIDYSDDFNYPYVSFVLKEEIPYFPLDLFVRYKNNSTIVPEKSDERNKIFSKISKDPWNNVNYTTVEQTEFVLNYYNVSKSDLFDKHVLDKYLMNDITIIPNKNYTISYYTNFQLLV